METITKQFFEVLATRLRNENDLSDITWTMIQISPFFKEKWLKFFFKNIRIEDIFSIEREVCDAKGMGQRVDFHITTFSDVNYIIEVKIGDQNQHFGFYDDAFIVTKDRFGYITNYPLNKEGYVVKQWSTFYEELISSLCSITDTNERDLIESYCCYLKNVCYIMEVKNLIVLEKMSSLYDLTIAFRKIVNSSNEHYKSEPYKEIPDDRAKKFSFKVKYTNIFSDEWFYPYVGIWYCLPSGPKICAGFWKDEGWGKSIVSLIRKKKSNWEEIPTRFTSGPELDEDGNCYFYMSEEAILQFNSAKQVEKQISILKNYLDEVLMFPVRLFEK